MLMPSNSIVISPREAEKIKEGLKKLGGEKWLLMLSEHGLVNLYNDCSEAIHNQQLLERAIYGG
jgi:hypothetical protein